MSLLLDSFSYRFRYDTSNSYLNRWHNHSFPEFSVADRMYFINNIITAILLHDKIYIHVDALEDFIELMGMRETQILLRNKILVILEGWYVLKFDQIVGPDNTICVYRNYIPTDKANHQIINRLNNRYRRTQTSYVEHVLNNDLCVLDKLSKIDSIAQENTIKDSLNADIRYLFHLESENLMFIKQQEIPSFVRLYNINRTIEWSSRLKTKDILLEDKARNVLACKAGYPYTETISNGMQEIWEAKMIPNFAMIYYDRLITMEEILNIRDDIAGIQFREWIKDKNYSIVELRKALMEKVPGKGKEDLARFIPITAIGCFNAVVGLGLSTIDFIYSHFSSWKPSVYFDLVISQYFDKKKFKYNPEYFKWRT